MKALIIVDMQNDFIDGSLGTKEAVAIVDAVTRRIENSRGEMIFFTQDTHGEDYLSTPEGKKLPVVHCVKGTKGWEIRDEILNALRDGDKTNFENENACSGGKIFEKNVFGSTELVEFIKNNQNEISEIEILGLCTDICVISNAIMLKNALPGIEISVNEK
ncbi:MAG: cysteine hydrolase, partial [Defluviitaleaceae bacterium]|nr:cysteine hydrolase [Defluviitaleaceae bacterium]